jgi:hypothetical protein
MPKWTKMPKSLKPWVIGLLVSLGVVVCLCGFVYLSFQIRAYHYRYVECVPEQLLADLERISDVNFPDNIKKVRAAKTIPIDGEIHFIIKYTCHQNVLNSFLESFPPDPLKELEPYDPASDLRKTFFWPPPRWFTEPIKHGKEGVLILDNRRVTIYIDTTSKKDFIVYIEGFYSKRAAEQSQ